MRKLDVFNHIYPTAYFEQMLAVAPGYKDIGKRMRGIPMLVDLDERFRVMDRFGSDYQQVLLDRHAAHRGTRRSPRRRTWPSARTTVWRRW